MFCEGVGRSNLPCDLRHSDSAWATLTMQMATQTHTHHMGTLNNGLMIESGHSQLVAKVGQAQQFLQMPFSLPWAMLGWLRCRTPQ